MPHSRTAAACLLGGLALLSAAPAFAAGRGFTSDGRVFVAGGIGAEEIQLLEAERSRYSLWVITAAKISGAYLADVALRISDEKSRRLVLERQLEGPWLLVDLPLGRYVVEASYRAQVLHKTTTIHPGDHHQLVFYFDLPEDALPRPRP